MLPPGREHRAAAGAGRVEQPAGAELAARINARLHERLGAVSDAEFMRAAFETVLATVPTAEEQKECEAALTELKDVLKGRPDAVCRCAGT